MSRWLSPRNPRKLILTPPAVKTIPFLLRCRRQHAASGSAKHPSVGSLAPVVRLKADDSLP